MASINEYKVNKLNQDVTLDVTIVTTKQFCLRMWAAKNLIKAAALILGCEIRINDEAD